MVNGLVRHVVQLIFKNTLQESESLSPALANLPSVSDSCYGLEISSGNFGLAVARRFHAEQLDPMYKQRSCLLLMCKTQRGAVEFFWIGGQQVDIDACPVFSKGELELWGIKAVVVPESL